jgi:DNA-directed RNA polymerase subunit alpha
MVTEDLVLPKKIKLDEKTATNCYGKFIAEPYESGYGHTVGNSLRRILLSSLEGAAVTAVRISGAVHEYSTLFGIREDVINILLNLKKIRFKLHGTNREYVRLSVKKSGTIKAGDIEETDNVKIVNKSQPIAHAEAGSKLNMEIEVSLGRGYISSEELSKIQRPAGFIAVDAIFSPVTRVHYDVEPARVGQKTDYDRLILEITTDATLKPQEALKRSAVILERSLGVFIPHKEEKPESENLEILTPSSVTQHTAKDSIKEDILNQPVDLIELTSRSANCLKTAKINTVRDLVEKTDEELKAIKNFGNKSLVEIKEKLTEMGLALGMKF